MINRFKFVCQNWPVHYVEKEFIEKRDPHNALALCSDPTQTTYWLNWKSNEVEINFETNNESFMLWNLKPNEISFNCSPLYQLCDYHFNQCLFTFSLSREWSKSRLSKSLVQKMKVALTLFPIFSTMLAPVLRKSGKNRPLVFCPFCLLLSFLMWELSIIIDSVVSILSTIYIGNSDFHRVSGFGS